VRAFLFSTSSQWSDLLGTHPCSRAHMICRYQHRATLVGIPHRLHYDGVADLHKVLCTDVPHGNMWQLHFIFFFVSLIPKRSASGIEKKFYQPESLCFVSLIPKRRASSVEKKIYQPESLCFVSLIPKRSASGI
jgi:hypothetical protein